jgi:hypothetical protein
MTWREYHQPTKHSVESLRRARRVLDDPNQQLTLEKRDALGGFVGLVGSACRQAAQPSAAHSN